MSFAAIKIKLMPLNPNVDFEAIEKEATDKIQESKGRVDKIEQEEVAFGLKAIIVTLAWPEEQETDILEKMLEDIQEVQSAQIIDHRRAFG